MESQKVAGGIAMFELKEFEWYGDDPNTAGLRQIEVKNKIRETAIAWRCDHVVAYVTPDELFSISPVPGRHRVWNENISPVFDITNVVIKQRIKPEMYNVATLEDRAYILDRAQQAIEDRLRIIERTSSLVVTYEIWSGETLVTKGRVT